MGIDCSMFVDGKEHQLDRWYVFEDCFGSGESVSSQEAVRRLKAMLAGVRQIVDDYGWPKNEYGFRVYYYSHWFQRAIEYALSGENVCFYPEHHIERGLCQWVWTPKAQATWHSRRT